MTELPQLSRTGAYAVIVDKQKILLCQLTRSRLWTLPGGGIEFGEHPEQAVVREVQEETGFIVKVNKLLTVGSHHAVKQDIELHQIQVLYSAVIIDGALQHEEFGSTDECRWHVISDLNPTQLSESAKLALKRLSAQDD